MVVDELRDREERDLFALLDGRTDRALDPNPGTHEELHAEVGSDLSRYLASVDAVVSERPLKEPVLVPGRETNFRISTHFRHALSCLWLYVRPRCYGRRDGRRVSQRETQGPRSS